MTSRLRRSELNATKGNYVNRRVLIVDDEPEFGRVLERLLELDGIAAIHLEDPAFLRKFNQAYYMRLNGDYDLTTSRALMVDTMSSVVAQIEMQSVEQWISKQHIFDCRVEPGRKIWVRTQHYPWEEFIIFQRIHYYETFEYGSEWAYWDSGLGEWVYHSLNGSIGSGVVTAGNGSVIWQGALLIEPTDNPPAFLGFGSDVMNFSTDTDVEPWPLGHPGEYLLGMSDLGLYCFDIQFDSRSDCHKSRAFSMRLGCNIVRF